MALSGIKRKAILARLLIVSSVIPRNFLSYISKNLPVNGIIVHVGGPIHPGGTIDDDYCCQHPLELDPNDPEFMEKTSGVLNMISDGTILIVNKERA